MTDEELAAYLGIKGHPKAIAVVKNLSPQRRALYERMSQVEIEIELFEAGLGPRPVGVILDYPKRQRRHHG
jgi:hypothetical protein